MVKIFTEKHDESGLEVDSPKTKIRISESRRVSERRVSLQRGSTAEKEKLLNGTKSPQASADITGRNTASSHDEIVEEA